MSVIVVCCPSLVSIINIPDITYAFHGLLDCTSDLHSFAAMTRRGVKSSLMNMRDHASHWILRVLRRVVLSSRLANFTMIGLIIPGSFLPTLWRASISFGVSIFGVSVK